MKKIVSLFLMVLLPLCASAYTAQIDGIYYRSFNSSEKTVEVTYRSDSYNSYSGDVIIPGTVVYQDITYTVTRIGYAAFNKCSSLTSVTIPNTITYIDGAAFANCSSLKSINIPNSVTSIGESAFKGCSGLTSVTIPNSVTTIGGSAFQNCTGLTKPVYNNKLFAYMPVNSTGNYTVPNGIETIVNTAFYGCDKLTAIVLPNSVKTVGYQAFGYTKLKTLIVGTGMLEFDSKAFFDYSSSSGNYYSKPVKTIWLTNTPPTNYKVAQGLVNYVANSQYNSIANMTVYNFLSSTFEVDGVKYVPISPSERTCDAIDCVYADSVSEVNISSTVSYRGINMQVQNVQPYTFYQNDNLQKARFDFAGDISNYAFCECQNLKEALLGKDITGIGEYAFSGCSQLEGIAIPDSVKTIGQYAFANCTDMDSVIIGSGTTTINQYAFQNCSALPSITIPGSVTSVGNYTFSGCKSLKEVIMADRDDEGMLRFGSNGSSPFFVDCPLDSVYIGRNISYDKRSNYGYSPFYRNETLRSVVITDKEEEISENEFYGCKKLQNVQIGDGVTEIGSRAFSGCASLKRFGFGAQVKAIGEEAFSDCTSLTAIVSKAETPPTCGSQALDDVNKWECTLTVPEGCVESYQAADQWKEFFFVEAADENGSTPIEPYDKKCATPTITFADGKLSFSCETDDVEFVFEVTNADVKQGQASEVAIDGMFVVNVYATKEGYFDSDVATLEFTLGAGGDCDVNGDGVVDVADIATIIDKMAEK